MGFGRNDGFGDMPHIPGGGSGVESALALMHICQSMDQKAQELGKELDEGELKSGPQGVVTVRQTELLQTLVGMLISDMPQDKREKYVATIIAHQESVEARLWERTKLAIGKIKALTASTVEEIDALPGAATDEQYKEVRQKIIDRAEESIKGMQEDTKTVVAHIQKTCSQMIQNGQDD